MNNCSSILETEDLSVASLVSANLKLLNSISPHLMAWIAGANGRFSGGFDISAIVQQQERGEL